MADPGGGTAPQGEGPTAAQLVRPRGDLRRPLIGALVTVALLVLAVLKPWGGTGYPGPEVESDAPSGGPAVPTAVSPSSAAPSATQPGYDAPGGQCFPGAGWRLFALEVNEARRLRAWLSIEPTAAGGPRDPAVPFVRIVTDRVLALGFCVGSGPGGPGPLGATRAWSLTPGRDAVPLALASLVEYTPWQPDFGAVYQPPGATGGQAGEGWLPGRYVFAVAQGPAEGDELWFGVELALPPPAPATP